MALRAEGNQHYASGRFDEALRAYSRAIEAGEPEQHLILSNRSLVHLQSGDPESALSDARAAVEADPSGGQWAKGFFRLAKALEANLKYKEAYEAAQKAVSLPDGNTAEARRLAQELKTKGQQLTEDEALEAIGSCLVQHFSGPIGTLHLDHRAFKRFEYLQRAQQEPQQILGQVFGPYAAPADRCYGPTCKEGGEVRFYQFPGGEAAVPAMKRFVEEGLCWPCQKKTPEKGKGRKPSSKAAAAAAGGPGKKVEAVLVTKQNFFLKTFTVDLSALQAKCDAGWLERHECEIPNTLLGTDVDLYCRVWSKHDQDIPGQNNEIATFGAARITTGFAPHTVLGEAVMVRRSGKPLNEIQAHNLLLLCMEMMDLYGDALRPQELLKSLRRHAQGFTRPFKPLTGPAEPDAERLLWALGLYRADMDSLQLADAAQAAQKQQQEEEEAPPPPSQMPPAAPTT